MPDDWTPTDMEKATRERLIEQLRDTGSLRFGRYEQARDCLLHEVLEEIRGKEPNLSDHGPRHVRNVLNNAYRLLGDNLSGLNAMELYILIMSIIFHDVGNFYGRVAHNEQITPIYDRACPPRGGNEYFEEKQTVLEICRAHTGISEDSTPDTLKFVRPYSSIDDMAVRPNYLAPILRFSDELAEGEQRTSYFMLKTHGYQPGQIVYHQYANCCKVNIDRPGNRIRLTYQIDLRRDSDPIAGGDDVAISTAQLEEFLKFVYLRIEKLNQERMYAKYYSPLLEPFTRTTVSFNFWYNHFAIPTDLQSVEISDLSVPGDPHRTFADYDNDYIPNRLATYLERSIEAMKRRTTGS